MAVISAPPRAADGAIRITLAGEPRPYRERQTVRAGHTWSYRPGTVRTYATWLRNAAQDAMDGRAPFDCAVTLTMAVYMPMPKHLRKGERLLAEQELLPVIRRPDTSQLLKLARGRAHCGRMDRRCPGRRASPRQALLALPAPRDRDPTDRIPARSAEGATDRSPRRVGRRHHQRI
jgi:Endodeoxyribonuclease RusA